MSGPLEERDEQQFYASERLKDCQHMILRIILELGLSESTFRRYRQKAIEDLAEMYLALQSAGVVLEWDD